MKARVKQEAECVYVDVYVLPKKCTRLWEAEGGWGWALIWAMNAVLW